MNCPRCDDLRERRIAAGLIEIAHRKNHPTLAASRDPRRIRPLGVRERLMSKRAND